MADRVGQQLGNYRLIRLLGRGGFAEVYLGEHLYLRNHAALKVLHTSLADKEVDQFLSEAQTLARLSHPRIVRVLDFAVEQRTPFLVLEYAPRGTLRTLHPRGSYLSLETTVVYVKQIAAALQFAHNHQVIHRDVKPENMLLDTQQQVMLSDFGLALFTPSPEQLSTQEMAGTLPYMAPEQIRGNPGFASDQYALSIVAYEWLCGVRPFEGTPWQIAYQQTAVAPPRLREHDSSLPQAVEAVVLKALAKDPRERYVSVQLFAQALERASQVNRNTLQADLEETAPLAAIPRERAVASRRVFLSAPRDDAAFAAQLATDLQRRGIELWQAAPKGSSNTSDQEDALRRAIRAVDVVLLVVSPHTRSTPAIREHLRIASRYQRRLVVVWVGGEDIATELPGEWDNTLRVDLVDARWTRYEQVLDELVACLEEEPRVQVPPLPGPAFQPRNPYKGLRAFTEDDAADFFGRDSLLEELTDRVRGMLGRPGAPTARMLTVIGASGSGKSSVVMAGLLPRLRQGALPASQEWVYLEPMVPGTHPLEALALTLAIHTPNRSLKALREDLEDDTARGLHLLASQFVKTPSQRVVLFIDQFEELFTQLIEEEERRRFIDVLVTAVIEPHGPVMVILTLRADFYDRPMSYPALHRLIQALQVSVLPMEAQDLLAAIRHPAALPDVQLTFEGDLVRDLLSEVQGQVGALPLLQFTLDQLFERRADHLLTLDAYHEIGGVKGALAQQAESTFVALPSEEHRRFARALFLRLIDPGMTEQDTTRRRAALAELSLPDVKQTTLMLEVADLFVVARLLTANEIAGSTTIEVSHEALIREWRRLGEWLREAREDISLQQNISTDAADWILRGRPVDRLYRGTQLAEALAWAERNVPNRDEVAFLEEATVERQQQEVAEQSRKVRELTLQRRVMSRQRLLLAALSLFTVVVLVLATIAEVGRLQADAQRQQAEMARRQAELQTNLASARALIAQANASLLQNQLAQALLLSAKAYQTHVDYQTRGSLLTSLEYSPHIAAVLDMTDVTNSPLQASDLVFSPDGRTLVSSRSSRSGSVLLWDTGTLQRHFAPSPLRYAHRFSFSPPPDDSYTALSPDGQILAWLSSDWFELWDIKTGLKLASLADHSSVYATGQGGFALFESVMAFSPHGNLVALSRCGQFANNACNQWQIHLWDVTAKTMVGSPLIAGVGTVSSLAFSPDGKTLASGSEDKTVRLWDVTTGTLIGTPLTGHGGTVSSLTFSRDGKTLASGSEDKTVRLWDVATGTLIGTPLTGHGGTVSSLAFSPDGKMLASGSEDKTVQLWDVATGTLIGSPLMGHQSGVTRVVFSPDGQHLASGSNDSTLLWNVTALNPMSRLLNDFASGSVMYSSDGRMVAASGEKTINLWDVASGTRIRTLNAFAAFPAPQDDYVASVALSPNGKVLASISVAGSLIMWNVATGTPIAHATESQVSQVYWRNIVFSPNGHLLATSTQDGIAFSPDGRILATGGTTTLWSVAAKAIRRLPTIPAGRIMLWDVMMNKPIGSPLQIGDASVGGAPGDNSIAFSPDGRTLGTNGGLRGDVLLWDVIKRTVIRQIATNAFGGLAFSPDGKTLAFSSNGAVTLWDLARNEPIVPPLQFAAVNNLAFSPDGKELAVGISRLKPIDGISAVVVLIQVSGDSWMARACRIAHRNFTADEWNQFAKGEPYRKVCPDFAVDQSVIQERLKGAHDALLSGHKGDATFAYAQATGWAVESEDADASDLVCRQGSLDQFARVVLSACEYAARSDPERGVFYDSRGLARALTGNSRGAIEDFKAFVKLETEHCLNSSVDPGTQAMCKQAIAKRNGWIHELEAGRNPFDAKTLNALAKEAYLFPG